MLQMSSSSNYERQSDNNSNVNVNNQMSRSNRSSKKKSSTAAPFLFLSNILKKKKVLGFEEIREMNTRTRSEPSVVSYNCSLPSRQPAVSSLSLTPARLYTKKDIEYDMQQLKLSRSDNPYIQKKLASRDEINMIDIDETVDDDTNLIPSLMSQDSENDDVFSCADVIDHMIRSPPPVSWRPIGSSFNFPCIDDGDDQDIYPLDIFSNININRTQSSRSSLSEMKFA